MRRNGTVLIGALLILIGGWLLLKEYGLGFGFDLSWPVLLIIIGGAMLTAYFVSKPKRGYVRGGSILVALGAYFTWMESSPWRYSNYDQVWPGVLIAIGLGLAASGMISAAERGMIGNGLMLAAIGALLLFFTLNEWSLRRENFTLFAGVVLIILGVKLVIDFFLKSRAEA